MDLCQNIKNIQNAIVNLERQKAQADGFAFLNKALGSLMDIVDTIPKISLPIPPSKLPEAMRMIIQFKKDLDQLEVCSKHLILT